MAAMKGAISALEDELPASSRRNPVSVVGRGKGKRGFCRTGTSVSIKALSRTLVNSYEMKKKLRLLWRRGRRNGPPRVKPGLCSCKGSRFRPRELFLKVFALSASSLKKANARPCNVCEPPRVLILMRPPDARPYSAEN